jgi:hypothetical protein
MTVFYTFFFLNCVWWNRSPCCLYFSLPPFRGQPKAKCHPRWQPISGLAVHCRLGRLLDSNSGLQFHNLVLLPMSYHCSLTSVHLGTWEDDRLHFVLYFKNVWLGGEGRLGNWLREVLINFPATRPLFLATI